MDTKYPIDPSDWQSCTVDSDCVGSGGAFDNDDDNVNDDDDEEYFCLPHMWEYNKQIDSGHGCWTSTVCSGSAAYELFNGRKLQFWCTGQQASKVADVEVAPFGLTWRTCSIAIDFRTVCSQDSDCAYYDDPEYNQQCLSGKNKQKNMVSSFLPSYTIVLMARLFLL